VREVRHQRRRTPPGTAGQRGATARRGPAVGSTPVRYGGLSMPPDTAEFDGFDDVVRVGQGGFGTVYRAVDRVLRRPVAIKALSTVLDEAAVERFRREAVAMSALSGHPNVVPLFSFGVRPDG